MTDTDFIEGKVGRVRWHTFHFSTAPQNSLVQPAIRRQPLNPAFATETAFLVAAERTRRVELVVGVRPDDAGAQLVDNLENLAALVRPHAGAQAVRRVICR